MIHYPWSLQEVDNDSLPVVIRGRSRKFFSELSSTQSHNCILNGIVLFKYCVSSDICRSRIWPNAVACLRSRKVGGQSGRPKWEAKVEAQSGRPKWSKPRQPFVYHANM